jgi:hypothetical protein
MRKALSLFLSAAIVSASLSATALAADTSSLPALELDTPRSFTFAPTAKEDQSEGVAEATFTPTQDGWYEFACDTPFSGLEPAEGGNGITSCTASICDETENGFSVVNMAWCIDFSSFDTSSLTEKELEAYQKLKEMMPHSTDVIFAAELEEGKNYVFRFSNESVSPFTTNLTVSTHVHEYTEEVTEKATVSNDTTDYGGVYRRCTWYCPLLDYTETFSAVNDCFLSKEKYVYDGKVKKPSVTVTTMDGAKLSSKYFTVSYKNNKKVGKATAVITFKGNYEGRLTRTFKIVPPGTKLTKAKAKKKAVALKWAKQNTESTGYQIQYATNKNFKSAKSVTVKKATSKTIKKLKAKKKYYFHIRTYTDTGEKKYYSGWSAVKAVKTK